MPLRPTSFQFTLDTDQLDERVRVVKDDLNDKSWYATAWSAMSDKGMSSFGNTAREATEGLIACLRETADAIEAAIKSSALPEE